MNQVLKLIHQINLSKKIYSDLYEDFVSDLEATKGQMVNHSDLYNKNEAQYYILLRCLHDLENYIGEQDQVFAIQEKKYFYNLYRYGRSLLKIIKFFPRLTYFFWQKSIGAYRDVFYERVFVNDGKMYNILRQDAKNKLDQLKTAY